MAINKVKLLTALMKAFAFFGKFFSFCTFKFATEPVVFDCGENYCVFWATTMKGTGSVSYTFEGKEYIVNDTRSGIISTDDKIHSVIVPKEQLENNYYSVTSQYVLLKLAYSAIKGKSVTSDKKYLRGYSGQQEISFLCLSDIHGKPQYVSNVMKHFDKSPDFAVLIGDVSSEMIVKNTFVDDILDSASRASRGEIPVVYARGNHETRGEFASQLTKYFRTDTNELYFRFNYGPISGTVLDTGEDKADDHQEYSGLVYFAGYREQEFNWLNSLERDDRDGVRYRIAFAHSPSTYDIFGQNWSKPLADIGTTLLLGGHHHVLSLSGGVASDGLVRFIDGGVTDKGGKFIGSMVTLSGGDTARFTAYNIYGELLMDKTMKIS